MLHRSCVALSVFCLVMVAACGAKMRMASAPMAAGSAPSMPQAPPPLERSLFDKNPQGALTEDAIQNILAAPIGLDLPARVGVLPIQRCWRRARV